MLRQQQDVDCTHATWMMYGKTVRCGLGLYGGRADVRICQQCTARTSRSADQRALEHRVSASGKKNHRILLRTGLSPGDVLMLTAAVRDLHRAYPNQFECGVDTTAMELWEHNPYITKFGLDVQDEVRVINMHYPLINQSNQRPVHFLQGYLEFLESELGLRIPLTEFKGDIHLSAMEKTAKNQIRNLFGFEGPFWIMIAGGKFDFTTKWWSPEYYQRVVDHFHGRIQFVQCGEKHHWHPPLNHVLDLIGKTTIRQFVQLMYHAEGVICPTTFAMHLAAAVPAKTPRLRPCVVVAGGREPPHWEAYPGHQFLHAIGSLPCCATGGCWKSRCQLVGDGDRKDFEQVCNRPVQITASLRIPQCMHLIKPDDVINAVERSLFYHQEHDSPA